MRKLALLCFGLLVFPAPALGANITWVSFHDTDAPSQAAADAGFTQAPDIGYTDLLSANGHSVTRFLTGDLTNDDLPQLNGSDLVIISRSTNSGDTNPPTIWNTMVTAPVINMHEYTLRSSRLNWSDGTTMVATVGPSTLVAADPSHPVFDGISLDGSNTMTNPFMDVVTENGALQRGTSINMNNLVGGTVVGSISDDGTATANGPVIAEWLTGATVNNGDVLAGPRLAFISGSREVDGVTSQTAGILDLTDDGTAMFLNAVNYMAIPEPSTGILTLLAVVGLGMLRRVR